jgi:hypothetical protein
LFQKEKLGTNLLEPGISIAIEQVMEKFQELVFPENSVLFFEP